jgi:hypothetical protein
MLAIPNRVLKPVLVGHRWRANLLKRVRHSSVDLDRKAMRQVEQDHPAPKAIARQMIRTARLATLIVHQETIIVLQAIRIAHQEIIIVRQATRIAHPEMIIAPHGIRIAPKERVGHKEKILQ